jgi:hypothetical protein
MQARLNRTNQYVHDYDNFVARLGDEIAQARNTARRQNLQLAVRPNMLSDQPKLAWDLARRLPDVQFYDYTKLKTVLTVGQPSNYHLTFSASEKSSPQFCADLLRGKIANVAIVFNVARGDALPYTHTLDGEVFPVIDGDLHDLRFLDPPGVIVGLRFKGGARAQTLATNGGFIRLTQVQDFLVSSTAESALSTLCRA